MLLGDDLNDISQVFSDCENAIERVELSLENMENWGSRWIIFPNAVYGSAANYAAQYGYKDLFEYFDYTIKDNDAWDIYD
jgi:predicted secreted acid phosphatase